ncbi:SMI1/KNR4 family protein [Chitinophaga flava]|uniref:Knr4/Smi1-like domain-containing protein n=1 Tax=Chitinophaga flava TaxID=2259036 RepID=A0A365XR39_9BACT|nr:SMI1/KNR4 family protein [Chitinophaga flava]RBL88829.1 hypothetical protein DF182_19925 [Chitinophaga flava]
MDKQLKHIETALGITLPGAYIRFLETQQSSESLLVTDLVTLYGTDDLIERNQTYAVQQYLPSYISIGDDSGGQGIFLDTSSTQATVYTTGYGALDPDCMEVLNDDFTEWTRQGYSLNIIRESPGVLAFRETETFRLRSSWMALHKALSVLETERPQIDLKTYLRRKRDLQKEMQDFEVKHAGKRYRL